MSFQEQRIATSYGYVRVIGRLVPVMHECKDGVTLARAAGASVERTIERAERMKQNKELN